MKKKLFLVMMAVATVFTTLSFCACSSSDDDNNTPGGTGKAQVTAYVAIAPDQLNLFDVTVKVNDGAAVQLTTSNTTLKEIVVATADNDEIKKTCRVYDLNTTTLTSFPGSYTLTAESKVKDGIELASQPKSDYSLSPVIELVDATGTHRTIASKRYIENVDWSKVKGTEIFLRAKTVSCSFDANGKTVFE